MNNYGQFQIIALCLIGLLFLTAIPLSQNIFVNIKDEKMFLARDKAFYLARAGLNKAMWKVKKEDWNGSHGEINDLEAKKILAINGEGIEESMGDGGFKYIKTIDQDKIYVMGFCGSSSSKAKSRIFIKGVNSKWKVF